jgi:hypothetical protein
MRERREQGMAHRRTLLFPTSLSYQPRSQQEPSWGLVLCCQPGERESRSGGDRAREKRGWKRETRRVWIKIVVYDVIW